MCKLTRAGLQSKWKAALCSRIQQQSRAFSSVLNCWLEINLLVAPRGSAFFLLLFRLRPGAEGDGMQWLKH